MTLVKRYPLITFFCPGLRHRLESLAVLCRPPFPFPILATGPALAALIVTAIISGWSGVKALLLRLVQWRVGLRWYVVALLLPVILWGAAVSLNVLLGAPLPPVATLAGWPSLVLGFLLYMVFPIGGPLGEESGWRGFALPRLQSKRSALASTWSLETVCCSSACCMPLLTPSVTR